MEHWVLKKRYINPANVKFDFNLQDLISELIARRPLNSREDVDIYINKPKNMEHNPFLFKDMEKGVNIILQCIQDNKKILLSLDYDVDGIISGAIAYNGLKKMGAACEYIFPHRVYDGYGINDRIIEYAKENGFETIITFDNGIAAFDAIDLAAELSIDVVVTDHHEVPQILNNGKMEDHLVNAAAIINPKQALCRYPFKNICGGMIAYRLVQGVAMALNFDEALIQEEYSFVSMATICDVMDLVDENRIIVSNGLKLLENTQNIGLRALFDELGISKVLVEDIGFKVGPCFNSSGRLSTAAQSLDLLTTKDILEAKSLASQLVSLNKERKSLSNEATARAIQQVEDHRLYQNNMIICYLEGIHESLAGIVAGQLKEKYHRPTLVLTDSNQVLKGSARSIDSVNVFEILSNFKKYFIKFGGHFAAAGLSLEKSDFEPFYEEIIPYVNNMEIQRNKQYAVDGIVKLDQIDLKLAQALEIFEPTGKGNPSIILSSLDLNIAKIYLIGKNKNVLKIDFVDQNVTKSFISFRYEKIIENIKLKLNISQDSDIIEDVPEVLFNQKFDILYKIGINRFNNNDYLNLELISIR